MKNLLDGRKTRLNFDNYTSEPILIDNGIGQGCPISMPAYIIYDVDLLELFANFLTIGYVDDTMVMATRKNFTETNNKIKQYMECQNRGFEWVKSHNSRFEVSKLAIMHCSQKRKLKKLNSNTENPIQHPTTANNAPPLTHIIKLHCIDIYEPLNPYNVSI